MTVLLTGQAGPAARIPRQSRPAAHRAVHRRHAARPDPLRQLLPQALVVAVLAGGTCALLAGDKEIHLSVDGEPRIHEGYYDAPNTFLLPHLGSGTIETRNAMGFKALDNLEALLLRNERPPNAVNA